MIPKHRISTHPGEILKEEFLQPLGIRQQALADAVGVGHHVISEIVNKKRGISPRMAALIAKALGTTPDFWIGLQSAYDLSAFLHGEGAAEIDNVPQLVP